MKKDTLTLKKAKETPAGGVLVGKREGQTMIYDDATVGGYFVGKLHKEGGIKGINKTTGQPIEVQSSEVIITAPAVSDQTKREFEGQMLTNREILSKINERGGGVSFADGGEIPAKIHVTENEYEFEGKMVSDTDLAYNLGWNSTLKKGGQIFSFFDKIYDVEKAYKMINSGTVIYDIKEVDTFPVSHRSFNEEYIKNLTPDFNVAQGLMIKHSSGNDLLIDGNHRMNNAYENGIKRIKVYYISNPKTIAKFSKKSNFKLGGKVDLAEESKKGDHPARDLNNYNDLMDVAVDGQVGAETGLYADGGNLDFLDEAVEKFDDGGSTGNQVDAIRLDTASSRYLGSMLKTEYDSFQEFLSDLQDAFITQDKFGGYFYFYVLKNGEKITPSRLAIQFKNSKNTVLNFNPLTGKSSDFYKQIERRYGSTIRRNNLEFTNWLGGKSTPKPQPQPEPVKEKAIRIRFSIVENNSLIAEDSLFDVSAFFEYLLVFSDRDIKVIMDLEKIGGTYIASDSFYLQKENEDIKHFNIYNVPLKILERFFVNYFPNIDLSALFHGKENVPQPMSPDEIKNFFNQQPEPKKNPNGIDLRMKKVWIGDNPELSKEIQKKAFELGFSWASGSKEVMNVNSKSLYFESNFKITHASVFKTYDDFLKEYEEYSVITSEEILGVKIEVKIDFEATKKYLTLRIADLTKELNFKKPRLSNEEIGFYQRDINELIFKLRKINEKELDFFPIKDRLQSAYSLKWGDINAEYKPSEDLLASNGLPTKLTDEEWVNVRTDYFSSFFGDWRLANETGNFSGVSKVIDPETKEPMPVYHGTNVLFTEWKTYKTNNAHYFAKNRDFSQWFAEQWSKGRGDISAKDSNLLKQLNPNKGEYLYRCFLDIKNPIDFSRFGVEKRPVSDFLMFLQINYNIGDFDFWTNFRLFNNLAQDTLVYSWMIIRNWQSFTEYIKMATTYDGYIFYEYHPEKEGTGLDGASLSFCAFDSSQIKFTNATEFNALITDSRFEKGGKL